jgi:hypothetical protein
MKYFQILDGHGDELGLFACPEIIDEKLFFQMLAGFDFHLSEFEAKNTIGAKRIFPNLIIIHEVV